MPDVVQVKGTVPTRLDAIIPNGQALSNAVELGGCVVGAILIPNSAGWTSAPLSFNVSLDGGLTYGDLIVDGTEYSLAVPTGRNNAGVVPVDPRWFFSVTHVRVRSGTAATPVNQGDNRQIQIGRIP